MGKKRNGGTSKKAKKSEFVLDLKQVFDDYMTENEKQWAHDRSTTVGASEVFGCLRKAWFDKRGEEFEYEKDPDYVDRWGATERGNIIEDHFVVPAVSSSLPAPLSMHLGGKDQVTLVKGRSSATPDGIIDGLPEGCALTVRYGDHVIEIDDIISDCINFEIKSIDPLANLQEERKKHNYQTHVQCGLIHEETKFRPWFSIIIYVNASWLDDITPFVVQYDPNIAAIGRERADDVYEVTDPNNIIPEGRMTGDCDYCDWCVACGTTILENMPAEKSEGALHEDDVDDFLKNIDAYNVAKAEAEAQERAKKIAQERIKEILMENKVRKTKIPQNGGSVSWSEVKGKKTLDKDAMVEDGIDLTKYEKTGNPYDRLNIRMKKEKVKENE